MPKVFNAKFDAFMKHGFRAILMDNADTKQAEEKNDWLAGKRAESAEKFVIRRPVPAEREIARRTFCLRNCPKADNSRIHHVTHKA